MDNFKLHVSSEGKKTLGLALALALSNAPASKATHFVVRPTKSAKGVQELLLCWAHDESHKTAPLPFELGIANAADFIWEWLEAQGIARANEYDDGDVDNGAHAFILDVGDWGHAGGSHYGLALVTPSFAWYGK